MAAWVHALLTYAHILFLYISIKKASRSVFQIQVQYIIKLIQVL